ncbi:MAG: hypothetical protein AB7I42_23045 [Bradyrhizobium sp.]|uniref:hypothetical protein n=1 Tax=Bradyrhizobium sp. TaxID=376 RepID=UPI003D1216B4
MSTSVTLIYTGGTVVLRGRAAAIAEELPGYQHELESLSFGSLQFHFAPTRLNVKLAKAA